MGIDGRVGTGGAVARGHGRISFVHCSRTELVHTRRFSLGISNTDYQIIRHLLGPPLSVGITLAISRMRLSSLGSIHNDQRET